MDKFTRQMLESTGLLGMMGKAERGVAAIDAIRDNEAVYLMAVGGAAYLVSKAIKHSRLLAFEDLGMEAIYEFDVVDMPVTVAVDAEGNERAYHRAGGVEGTIAHSMDCGRRCDTGAVSTLGPQVARRCHVVVAGIALCSSSCVASEYRHAPNASCEVRLVMCRAQNIGDTYHLDETRLRRCR